jgi:acetyl-CoA acetyltransferase
MDNAARASGSVATLAAMADLRSGAYDTALVHPVGASGVRMLLDAAKRVSGAAGDYQVEGAAHLRHFAFRWQHRHHRQFRCQ